MIPNSTPKQLKGYLHFVRRTVLTVLAFVLAIYGAAQNSGGRGNLPLLLTIKQLANYVEPLSPKDLFGLSNRPTITAFDKLLLDFESSARVPGIERKSDYGPWTSATLWLLVGQPNKALSRIDGGTSVGQLAGYLQVFAYSQLGATNEAEEALRKLPGSLQYLRDVAYNAWDNRIEPDVDLAIASAELFLKLAPQVSSEYVDIYRILSYALERAGNRARAIETAELWVGVALTDCAASEQLAALYLRNKDYQSGFRVLIRSTLNAGKKCPRFQIQMGQAYDLAGNLPQAIAYYRIGVSRNPNDAYAHWYLGQALYRNGQIKEAAKHLDVVEESSYAELREAARQLRALIESKNCSQ